eukprot:2189846-Prymnesium_polylepis.3
MDHVDRAVQCGRRGLQVVREPARGVVHGEALEPRRQHLVLGAKGGAPRERDGASLVVGDADS